jgi:hypothetical protein
VRARRGQHDAGLGHGHDARAVRDGDPLEAVLFPRALADVLFVCWCGCVGGGRDGLFGARGGRRRESDRRRRSIAPREQSTPHDSASSASRTCILRSAIGPYASYSSRTTRRPSKWSRVVPTKAATAPQHPAVTMAVKRATSSGAGVTSTNHPSPDCDMHSVVGGGCRASAMFAGGGCC